MLPPSPQAYGGSGPTILGVTWGETLIATVVIIARAYTTIELVERARWDLFWAIITWITCFTAQALATVGVAYGAGNHIDNLDPNDILQSIKWAWLSLIVGIFAIGFGKIAVIALLLQIQGPTHTKKAYFLHFIWITNTIFNVMQVVLILCQCQPARKLWDSNLPGDCDGRIRGERTGFFQGSWAVASDISLAVYPIVVFWDLDMSRKRKLGLCLIMGGGFIAAIAGILKTLYIKLAPLTTDITDSIYPLLISASTEMWIIVILGSVPQLRILFVIVSAKLRKMARAGPIPPTPRARGPSRQMTSSDYAELGQTPYVSSTHVQGQGCKDSVLQHSESGDDTTRPQDAQIIVTTDFEVMYEECYSRP